MSAKGPRSSCVECNGTGEILGYGGFPGGDPKRFFPDEESCFPEEIERWQKACEERNAAPADYCGTLQRLGAPKGPGFGIGAYTIPCTSCYPCDCEFCRPDAGEER